MWSLYAIFGVATVGVCLTAPWDFLSAKPGEDEDEEGSTISGEEEGKETKKANATKGVLLQTVVNFFLTTDLNASKTLLGLLAPISVLLEVPLFFLSSRVISRIGFSATILIGVVAQLARAGVYIAVAEAVNNGGGWLADARWILAGDVLQGGSFALFWSALFGHVSEKTPESVKGTMVGILNAVSFGVASVVGS
ncbi:hypothetical protein HDU93_010075 [Gonapodya sp. JEL0774]|nr:hypothetical protein HDU93_010075 [Gonapodya sp. JEL0774]